MNCTFGPVPSLIVPIPHRENVRARALRLLLEGRVRVKVLHHGRCYVEVIGDSGQTRVVIHRPGVGWRCSCPARRGACAHVAAAQQVVDLERGDDR